MLKRYCRASLLALALVMPLAAEDAHTGENAAPEQHLASLQAMAEAGDMHAVQQLYMRYAVEGRTEQARAWADKYNELLAKQAEAGDTQAMLRLGSRYLTGGDYTEPSTEKAVVWFTRASEAGEASAAYMLGEIFSRQGNVPMAEQGYTRAYALYSERAASGTDPEALYWQGFMEQNGIGTQRDAAAGIAKLEQAANLGSAWAASQLFKTHYNGIGVPKDEAKALSFACKLAEEKHDGTMAYVAATAYLYGNGVQQDTALGERYLDIAVRANIPDAIYMKANRLDQAGKLSEALPYYRQAASMHQREALVFLGRLLLDGPEAGDEARGLSMLEIAAGRLNSPRAAWELARYYDEAGESDLADSWYVAASDRGVAEAMARRGLLHLIPGGTVSWSPTEAYRWWRIGKQAGDATCSLYLSLFLYVLIPIVLLLAFGTPAYIGYRAKKRAQDDQSNSPAA